MDERQEEMEKEGGEVEERAEERTGEKTEEGTEERGEHSEVTEEACEEYERCEEDSEFHSAKRARVCATFSSGFEASPNTSRRDESCGSTTDTEHLESSVLRESRNQSMITSTPVSTDSKILEHFDQMRTLISGFLQQKSDRQPFFDYVTS